VKCSNRSRGLLLEVLRYQLLINPSLSKKAFDSDLIEIHQIHLLGFNFSQIRLSQTLAKFLAGFATFGYSFVECSNSQMGIPGGLVAEFTDMLLKHNTYVFYHLSKGCSQICFISLNTEKFE